MRCEICGSEENITITNCTRDGGGAIAQCKKCGLIFQDCEYDEKELQKYYNDAYFSTNSLDSESVQTPKEHFESRLGTLSDLKNDIVNLIQDNYSYKPSILEVGASAGELLHLLSDHAKKLVGIELNREYCEWANKELQSNIEMISRDLNDVRFNEKFDLIISNYTIDHLTNPYETLMRMRSLLNDNGMMYILVPNRDEALNYYASPKTRGCYQTFFWHKAHMFYFTKDTLGKLLDKCNLEYNITCFHQYSLRNFLQWYYVGEPGQRFDEEVNESCLFSGKSQFELLMNQMMEEMDGRFKKIMSDTWGGDTLRAIVRKRS